MARDYDNGSQLRILRALTVLAGQEFHGVAPGELAKALDVTPGTVTRDLHNLRSAGFAEPIQETGRWRLGPKLVQIAVAFSAGVSRAESRLAEINNRYTREP
ncbi:MAG: HTH domain-containing protein [Rhodocyclaceae bacterium]|nr:HTH domain-containing protein [Rhodocyclaceae bacterium]